MAPRYDELDRIMSEWFNLARSKNVIVSRPLFQEKALEIGRLLDPETTFAASNGWAEKFFARHSIIFRNLCGEGASVNRNVVETWKANLPSECEGYAAEDIYNLDETGLFFEALPTKSYVLKGEKCQGGKNSKSRLTVCFITSLTGEKEPPIIIGKSQRPRAFKRINIDETFNVMYRFSKKAWMTSVIFEEYIVKLNNKMQEQNRQILLFLDNASVHKELNMSNVTMKFFPPNTTTELQPLDQGIISNFKCHYRKQLLRKLCSSVDVILFSPETQFHFEMNILDSVTWIKNAWDAVKSETITKCFGRSGFITPTTIEEDMLVSDSMELAELMPGFNVEDYVECDSQVGK